jgi:DNA-binding Xre family transcriptional regulator
MGIVTDLLPTSISFPNINRIKAVLADKSKSNKWLSEQLGVAPTTVSKWCTNSTQPPIETFIKIAMLLEVDINELIRYNQYCMNQSEKDSV